MANVPVLQPKDFRGLYPKFGRFVEQPERAKSANTDRSKETVSRAVFKLAWLFASEWPAIEIVKNVDPAGRGWKLEGTGADGAALRMPPPETITEPVSKAKQLCWI